MRPNSASVLLLFLSLLPQVFPGPPSIDGKADSHPASPLKAEIDALAAAVHAANTKAQALAEDQTLDPDTRTLALPQCLAFYRDAIASLDKISTAPAAADVGLMRDSFASIDSLASLCEDAFDAAHLPSPLRDENRVIGVAGLACIGKAGKPPPLPPPPSLRGSAFPPSPASSPASPQRSLGPLDPLDLTAVCSMTRDMSFCISAVQSVATGPLKTTNAAAVLKLTVNATIASARKAIDATHALSTAHSDEPRVQEILNNVCAVKYRRAIKKLHEAEEAISKGDKLMLKKSLSTTGHFMACDRAFSDAGLPMLMEDYSDDLKGLAVINLGIAKVFWPDPVFDKEYDYVLRDIM